MVMTPLDAAEDVFDRGLAIVRLVNADPADKCVDNDLLASGLVFAVSGLDTYLHRRVVEQTKGNTGENIPSALRKLSVDFGSVFDMAVKSIEARKEGVNDRPRVRAQHVLQEAILQIPFQSARSVEDAMAMCGVRRCFTKIYDNNLLVGSHSADEIREELNRIVRTRNRIVHEGDLTRQLRPQKLWQELHKCDIVVDRIEWLRRLVGGLDQLS